MGLVKEISEGIPDHGPGGGEQQEVERGVEGTPDPPAPAQRAAGDGCLVEGLAEVFHGGGSVLSRSWERWPAASLMKAWGGTSPEVSPGEAAVSGD